MNGKINSCSRITGIIYFGSIILGGLLASIGFMAGMIGTGISNVVLVQLSTIGLIVGMGLLVFAYLYRRWARRRLPVIGVF